MDTAELLHEVKRRLRADAAGVDAWLHTLHYNDLRALRGKLRDRTGPAQCGWSGDASGARESRPFFMPHARVRWQCDWRRTWLG